MDSLLEARGEGGEGEEEEGVWEGVEMVGKDPGGEGGKADEKLREFLNGEPRAETDAGGFTRERIEAEVVGGVAKYEGEGVGGGAKYEGEGVNGVAEGAGQLRFSNGDVYTGTFTAGTPHGRGTWEYMGGDGSQAP
ncbi:hypothetical protein T484DRAFT_1807380 [Baffinella frigidus]|nr:hypothetical protein T484DRAFT_1807380 [Cryptophyta sp. CCMP2293]